jgi:hypothetical protein
MGGVAECGGVPSSRDVKCRVMPCRAVASWFVERWRRALSWTRTGVLCCGVTSSRDVKCRVMPCRGLASSSAVQCGVVG